MKRLMALIGTALAGCVAAASPPEPDLGRLVRHTNDFAFDLYGQLKKHEGNVFFSPYSISTALAMTYAGARGETADQMARTLHFKLEPSALHDAFAQLVRQQNAGSAERGYELAIANALWGQKGFTFRPDFIELVGQHYGGALHEADFRQMPEAARQTINDWVAKQTRGKIEDLLPRGVIDPDTRLVLTNAVYFKSPWFDPFREEATSKDDFLTLTERKIKVPMMQRRGTYSFYEDEDVQLLDMPYERRALSLIAVLPREKTGLARLEKNISAAKLEGWLKLRKPYQVDVKFPKFKVTYDLNLNKTLSALGMPLAFSERADFSGISSEQKLQIASVLHKAFIDLNEKGTEAAAATGVVAKVTAAPVPPADRAVFHADHPFLFLIRDNRTGCILFMGRLVQPQ